MSAESLVVYLNGEYVPRNQARISIFDVGFLRGDAVFDTTSAWNGRIFKLPAHLERLELSLRAARIRCPRRSRVDNMGRCARRTGARRRARADRWMEIPCGQPSRETAPRR